MINFPLQTTQGGVDNDPQLSRESNGNDAAHTESAVVPTKSQNEGSSAPQLRKLVTNVTNSTNFSSRSDQSKESFDNQKKSAMANGPVIRMEAAYFQRYAMPESLFTALKDIFEAIIAHDSRIGVVVPIKFLDILRENNEAYRGTVHQDAHEFLNLLLNDVVDQVEQYSKKSANSPIPPALESRPAENNFVSSLPYKASSSWVHELFEGTLASETRCLSCENVSRVDEVFLDLSLDIEEHTSITNSLRKFSEEEMLCERNKFHCDRCGGLQEAEKRMKINRLPRVLALHLKRFKYYEQEARLHKLFHRVVFPFHLRLLNTTDDAEDPDRLYELYAVIVHLGTTPFHGHYVAIIKTQERGWLLFDDELVLPVDANYVRNFFGTGDSKSPACAYVLFYQETTMESVYREQDVDEPSGEEMPRFSGEPIVNAADGEEATSPMISPATDPVPASAVEDRELMAALENPVAGKPSSSPGPGLVTPTATELFNGSASKPSGHDLDQAPSKGESNLDTTPHTQNPRVSFEGEGADTIDTKASISENKPPKEHGRLHHAMSKGTLAGRFRNTSLSLKAKPKLWGSKDRGEMHKDIPKELPREPSKESADEIPTTSPMNPVSSSDRDDAPIEALPAIPAATERPDRPDKPEKAEKPEKPDKSRMGRFNIGRKKSGMFS